MDNLKILVLFKMSCVCISVSDFLFAVCSSYESHERFFFVQIKKYVKKWLPTHETKYNKKKNETIFVSRNKGSPENVLRNNVVHTYNKKMEWKWSKKCGETEKIV